MVRFDAAECGRTAHLAESRVLQGRRLEAAGDFLGGGHRPAEVGCLAGQCPFEEQLAGCVPLLPRSSPRCWGARRSGRQPLPVRARFQQWPASYPADSLPASGHSPAPPSGRGRCPWPRRKNAFNAASSASNCLSCRSSDCSSTSATGAAGRFCDWLKWSRMTAMGMASTTASERAIQRIRFRRCMMTPCMQAGWVGASGVPEGRRRCGGAFDNRSA